MTPTRKIVLAISGACLGLAVVAVAWLVVTAVLARSQLNAVKSELPPLQQAISAHDTAGVQRLSGQLATHAERAHALTSGPAWWTAANLPVVGAPLRTTRGIAAASDQVGSTVLPGVITLFDQLDNTSLRHGNHIDLQPIAVAEPVLARSASAAATAYADVAATPASSWLGSVDQARGTVLDDVNQLSGQLAGASRTVSTVLPMLGQSGKQRYFVALENEAEARGLGGLPGAFAIVTADHGTLTFTHFENDSALDGVRAHVDLGADYAARYQGAEPTGLFVNSDISPHFPDAARTWASMWQQKSGERVDGAIALDPTALSYLLAVTGPAQLPDGSVVSAQNVVQLTEKDEYSRFSNTTERKQYLVHVAEAVSARLTGSGANFTGLVHAAAQAAGERRLVLWSADRAAENNLAASGYGGIAEGGHGPFSGFVVVNAAGSKLDYYLDRTVSYRRTACSAGSTAVASIKLTNTAPASGLPAYVTTRGDSAPKGAKPGDNRLLVTYYAGSGATIPRVLIDGKPQTVATAPENGLVTATVSLELPVGATRTVTVTVAEPNRTGPVTILRQPLVRPLTVTPTVDRCAAAPK